MMYVASMIRVGATGSATVENDFRTVREAWRWMYETRFQELRMTGQPWDDGLLALLAQATRDRLVGMVYEDGTTYLVEVLPGS